MRSRALFIFYFLCIVPKLFGSVAENKPELVLQTGHAGAVRAVAISPDGSGSHPAARTAR